MHYFDVISTFGIKLKRALSILTVPYYVLLTCVAFCNVISTCGVMLYFDVISIVGIKLKRALSTCCLSFCVNFTVLLATVLILVLFCNVISTSGVMLFFDVISTFGVKLIRALSAVTVSYYVLLTCWAFCNVIGRCFGMV